MTDLEAFRSTVEHRAHDEFLYYAKFTPDLGDRMRKELGLGPDEKIEPHLGMYDAFEAGSQSLTQHAFGERPELLRYYSGIDPPPGSVTDHLGVLRIPGDFFHFTSRISPLRNAESLKELEDFPYPEAPQADIDAMRRQVAEAHRSGLVAACNVGHIYENSWQIRGYEEFLLDMVDQPEFCECVLDRICDKNFAVSVAATRAGIDVLYTADDVANQNALMFSPGMWRRFIKSRWVRVYEAVRSIKPDIQIWYHSDGNIMDIIPELIDIGVTILNPVQPECVDVLEVKRLFGDRLVLDGTIGTQITMPFGSPEDVKRVVGERKELLGRDGALILSPTHVLEPEVPIENIKAFVEACQS